MRARQRSIFVRARLQMKRSSACSAPETRPFQGCRRLCRDDAERNFSRPG
ncbi:hypothetical protein ebA2997 [Aromatoleum aromaticum EbN1]|uniref:Uncharacterized protein n=1 Tax=Aromatoleum aromaticum (strain DSM 19018 / LMG 30748 / EbN1) TaxID=76114 RepID=Q5P4F0_AROAE|nr:hypothetical protein ebA2997 [Aromatoleum aromaticum EbN1]